MGIDLISLAYAASIAAGGLAGYLKAGSTVSLGAGVLFGGLAGLGAYKSTVNPGDHWLTLGIALTLSGLMGARFYSSGKFMPAGMVALMRRRRSFTFSRNFELSRKQNSLPS